MQQPMPGIHTIVPPPLPNSSCALQNVSHQKVRLFAEAFAKIQDATGISDIDDLVKAFATAEVGVCASQPVVLVVELTDIM